MSNDSVNSGRKNGRPAKGEPPRVPYEELDRILVFGEVVTCEDGDDCTTDYCDPSLGACKHPQMECGDADPCTADSCQAGECVNQEIPGCLGCEEDSQCDDSDLCTTDGCNTLVDPGECTYTAISCADGNACTNDFFNPLDGECVNNAIDCGDGNACTVDTCNKTSGACGHSALSCDDDGDPCTLGDRCSDHE